MANCEIPKKRCAKKLEVDEPQLEGQIQSFIGTWPHPCIAIFCGCLGATLADLMSCQNLRPTKSKMC